jgi:hypothetical protein
METDMGGKPNELQTVLNGRGIQATSAGRATEMIFGIMGSSPQMSPNLEPRLKRLESLSVRKFRAGQPTPRPTRPTSAGSQELEYVSNLAYTKTTPTIGGRTVTMVAMTFARPADQRNWDSAKIYVRGYLGNPNFVQMSEAKTSPSILIFEQTGETLTISASSRNLSGQQQDYKKLATVSLTV